MHLMNFKELSNQELNDLVTEGIEIKHDPERVRKNVAKKVFGSDFSEDQHTHAGFI